MNNNFSKNDMIAVRKLLKKRDVVLTKPKIVEKFETAWS